MMYSNNNYFNQKMYSKVNEANIINITFSADGPQVLFDGENEVYSWNERIYLWSDPEINGREMTVRNTDILEFNKYCIDFLVDELINSFDSYESINVGICYTNGLYW